MWFPLVILPGFISGKQGAAGSLFPCGAVHDMGFHPAIMVT
ncbi:hypothetical protein JOE21_001786 [Desmospora profundinema]|uniref:Uncharacterized protein n=1 Tax=Desmospora profundinema TaxID=1571184 RepID=A0ABU1IM13_9BACL|nr:hypothetical protein [Desmospora profundinema]